MKPILFSALLMALASTGAQAQSAAGFDDWMQIDDGRFTRTIPHWHPETTPPLNANPAASKMAEYLRTSHASRGKRTMGWKFSSVKGLPIAYYRFTDGPRLPAFFGITFLLHVEASYYPAFALKSKRSSMSATRFSP